MPDRERVLSRARELDPAQRSDRPRTPHTLGSLLGVHGVYVACAGAAVLFPASPVVRGALLVVGVVTLGGRVLGALTEAPRGRAPRRRRGPIT
jgi:hypothetical protein